MASSLAVAATAANPVMPTPPSPSITHTVIASGEWNGHAWTLKAGDDATGRHCLLISIDMQFTTVAPPHSPNCIGAPYSQPPPSAPPNWPFGIGFSSLSPCPLAFVDGTAAPSAKKVEITVATGATVRTATIVPPAGLSQDVRYFVTQLPCGARMTKIVALDGAGQVVGRFYLRLHH